MPLACNNVPTHWGTLPRPPGATRWGYYLPHCHPHYQPRAVCVIMYVPGTSPPHSMLCCVASGGSSCPGNRPRDHLDPWTRHQDSTMMPNLMAHQHDCCVCQAHATMCPSTGACCLVLWELLYPPSHTAPPHPHLAANPTSAIEPCTPAPPQPAWGVFTCPHPEQCGGAHLRMPKWLGCRPVMVPSHMTCPCP